MKSRRVAVLGAGHNGLVCAAYLARAGLDVEVFERRECVGGACVTEELWPGYRVSRGAYVLSLLRPRILDELDLRRRGLRLLPRSPASFTPLADGRSLVLGDSPEADVAEIRRFSEPDALAYPAYEAWLARVAQALEPTLDRAPPLRPRRPADLSPWWGLLRVAWALRSELPESLRLLLGSARSVLDEHFESDVLKSTLATDAVIGAFAGPSSAGTGYVLFHHVMGACTGRRGVWAYVEGGMGALSEALADAAREAGARIWTGREVCAIQTAQGQARGIRLEDGGEMEADAVVSGLTPAATLRQLDDASLVSARERSALEAVDYRSPVVKLNLALGELPRFRPSDRPEPPLSGTIHIGPEDLDGLDRAYRDAASGQVSQNPAVELTIPSVLDPSLAPRGRYVASIFAQYAPVRAADDAAWPSLREQMQERALASIEARAPGFRTSIEHLEVLAAPDLEEVFGLTGGNIFHGAMSPDRLLSLRPAPGWRGYRSPLPGLYLCGSGTHPGGGVMGAPGRNAALQMVRDLA